VPVGAGSPEAVGGKPFKGAKTYETGAQFAKLIWTKTMNPILTYVLTTHNEAPTA
jgi:hypothetical protein